MAETTEDAGAVDDRPAPTAYRLPTGRIVHVTVVTAPPIITYELAPGIMVCGIRADLREPY
jgi:hypothetical protein